MLSRFERENNVTFAEFNFEDRLTALRIWADAAPSLWDHGEKFGAQIENATREAHAKSEAAKRLPPNERALAVEAALSELFSEFEAKTTEFSEAIKRDALALGVAIGKLYFGPVTPANMQ